MQQQRKKTKLLKRGIVHDPIPAKDFRELNLVFACEHCSYFDGNSEQCIFGHNAANHRYDQQIKTYHTTGRMAICRNLEID